MINLSQKAWYVGITAGAILCLYLLTLSISEVKSMRYIGSAIGANNTILVSGTGDAYTIPDVATFSFSVNKTAKTVTLAQTAATAKINEALKTIRAGGVADADIQTTSYSINPHYEYMNLNGVCVPVSSTAPISPEMAASAASYCPSGKSVLTGYDVSQSVTIKIRNLDKAGELFASIGSLGVDSINGLSFLVDKPDSIQDQAREKAITDAKSKAQELAAQLGVHLVRIISFSENGGGYNYPMAYATMDSIAPMVKMASPEIPRGQQKTTSSVNITYEIK
jgi:uncharacterized protein